MGNKLFPKSCGKNRNEINILNDNEYNGGNDMVKKTGNDSIEHEKFPDPSKTATVGWFKGKTGNRDYKVFIVGEEDITPHFYFRYKKEGDSGHFIATIRIKDFQIMGFKDGRKRRLPKKLFKLLIYFLKSLMMQVIFKEGATRWDFLLDSWDNENPDYPINFEPDISEIEKNQDFTYDPKLKL